MSMMVVVVAFHRGWQDVPAIPALEAICSSDANPRINARQVLVYENGKDLRLSACANKAGFLYEGDRSNGGTRSAYTAALRIAQQSGLQWLLILDHDTAPSSDFFYKVAEAIGNHSSETSQVAALVPEIVDQGVHVSPSRVRYAGRLTPLCGPLRPGTRYSAIASGSVFRISFFSRLTPLPEQYWLDGLDHWIFWNLHRAGLLVSLLKVRIEHSLSIRSLSSVSAHRYAHIVTAELHLASDTMGAVERLAFRARLMIRAFALLLLKGLPTHASIALRAALWYRP